MAESWQIRVFDNQQAVYSCEVSGRVELGRQGDGGERLYSKKRIELEDRWRLVVAGRDEDSVSRRHALLEPSPAGGHARLTNLSAKVPIRLHDGGELGPLATCDLSLPAVLTLGRKVIRVLEQADNDLVFQSLPEATSPGMTLAPPSAFASLTLPASGGGEVNIEEMIEWLKAAMGVLQSAATSSEFFEKAARAVVETVGLDTGYVVLREDEDWRTLASSAAPGVTIEADQAPSRNVLGRVRLDRRTLWHVPDSAGTGGMESLLGVSAVVASPILDVKGEVIGALYGDRRKYASPGNPPRITKLDAMLVELLANGVAAGLARMEAEEHSMAARVRFEQFFTPELAHQIAIRPELLEGQDAEITLLFCDIRGFSRISEHLGPAKTVRWINGVMGALSDCVIAHRGVLVDYIGDELMAMWGAPEEQPDHALLACRAALDMIDILPALNVQWLEELGEPLDVGIGINTGVARVGNTGSHRKFKYGPLGNTVNMASRVQGVTKYLKVRLLVTEATRERLDAEFAARRIGKVRVVNIAAPVNLYELSPPGVPQWEAMCLEYESALAEFERQGFYMAARILGGLLNEHRNDGPSVVLLSRVVAAMVDPDTFDPVFVTPGK